MKTLGLTLGLLLMLTGLLAAQDGHGSLAPFAVVELFASEGCSSCPPADRLLRQITQDARSQGKRIYTLSFQVDYWNYLGWEDPFSSSSFTQRQQQYAQILSGGVYTPEMIVNGQEAFVGSNEPKARQAIDHFLSLPAQNSIQLNLKKSDDRLIVDYACAHADDKSVLHVALVERGLQSHPTAGENEGRDLVHDNIVREFKTVDLHDPAGTVVISKPVQKDSSRFSIVAFIQSKTDMTIAAASGIDV